LKKTTERLSGATGLTKLEITAIFFIVASLLVGSGFFLLGGGKNTAELKPKADNAWNELQNEKSKISGNNGNNRKNENNRNGNDTVATGSAADDDYGFNSTSGDDIKSDPSAENGKQGGKTSRKKVYKTININTATIDDFDQLPGISTEVAENIVKHRVLKGGSFKDIEELLEVKGIGKKRLEKIKPYLKF